MTEKKTTKKTTTRKTVAKKAVVENKNTVEVKNKHNEVFTVNLKQVEFLLYEPKKYVNGNYVEHYSLFTSSANLELTKEQYEEIKQKLGE